MRDRRGLGLDLLCVALVLAMGILHWPTGELSMPTVGPDVPWWGTVRDALLDGPDAGEWAKNMLALQDGRVSELDSHRLPGWVILVNGILFFEPDVARAGHLMNHLLLLALGLGVFLIGRLGEQRWVGLGGAALAMLSGHAIEVSMRFGVDAAVIGLIPWTLVGALLACRKWQLGLLSGAIAGLVTGLHFSTIPYALPALALIVMVAKKHRWRAAAAHVLGTALVLWGVMQIYPVSSLAEFKSAIANGIAPGYQGGGSVGSLEASWAVIEGGRATALNRAVAQLMVQIRPSWLPWGVGLLLPWLGILGIGLKKAGRESGAGKLRWIWARMDLGLGLGLLFCLAPLPILAAAQAPLRYADNLSPAGALLLVRGMASVVLILGFGIRWIAPTGPSLVMLHRIPAAALTAALGLTLAGTAVQDASSHRRPLLPTVQELGYWQLGQALAGQFPAGTGVASPIREALVPGRLQYCPRQVCPVASDETEFWRCLSVMKVDCAGQESLGYVTTDAELYDPNAVGRRDMDKWVADHFELAQSIELQGFNASLYLIPRDEVPDLDMPQLPPDDAGAPRGPGQAGQTADPDEYGPADVGPVGPPDAGGSGPPR
jgi:hypothetical protein